MGHSSLVPVILALSTTPGVVGKACGSQVRRNPAQAVPNGAYHMRANRGTIFVGISHDSPDFVVKKLVRCWSSEGGQRTCLVFLRIDGTISTPAGDAKEDLLRRHTDASQGARS